MRFRRDGPDIPEHLLQERDLGNVVLFCGAGISIPAGLPDFAGLAEQLLDELGATRARIAKDRGDSLDNVFKELAKEFGRSTVDAHISQRLRTPAGADLRFHEIALALSGSAEGRPQLVTTNFDLLFEAVEPDIRRYVPPALPDLQYLHGFDGLVYLHGRLEEPDPRRTAGYVISSADFGRAYLAEGWAARFVRALRERYTIVLLGYSANDPPMRYLLEGLNAREGASYPTPIYTFAPGTPGEIEEDWRDRGVTPIAYDPLDAGHSGLWDSLAAWAEAARDPDTRRQSLVALAQRHPRDLEPFERGQVGHLVSSRDGAQAFAAADPPPPAEWLCVFDRTVRYARPGRAVIEQDSAVIDPFDLYRLDSDPPRPPADPRGVTEIPGQDLLQWRPTDPAWPERVRLGGWWADGIHQLPPRLYHLTRWFARVLDQPAAIWWAAGNSSVHPQLIETVRDTLQRRPDMHERPRFFWWSYAEAQTLRADQHESRLWYAFGRRIAATGWTAGALREFERAIQPYHVFSRPRLQAPVPPTGDWDELDLRKAADIKARLPSIERDVLDVDLALLPPVIAAMRRALEETAALVADGTDLFWRTPSLHPSGRRGASTSHGRKAGFFLAFRDLIDRLTREDAERARLEVRLWRQDDIYFFGKLSIYAAMQPALYSGREAADLLLALPVGLFWDHNNRRELLFTLRARWPDLSVRDRRAIERRIIAGDDRWEGESDAQYRLRTATQAAQLLSWLRLKGCDLTPGTARILPGLIAQDEHWSDAYVLNADESNESIGGWVERNTELQGLEQEEIGDVPRRAAELSTSSMRDLVDFRPFDGLVKERPLRALSALRFQARRGEYPPRLWEAYFSGVPEGASPRLRRLALATVARLPDAVILAHRFALTSWLALIVPPLARADRGWALTCHDRIVETFLRADPAMLASAVGESSVGGVPRETSQYSFMKALNSPAGHLAGLLTELLGEPEGGQGFASDIKARIETLWRLPGDGGGHALCRMTRQLSWIEHVDPAWVAERFLPLFQLDHRLAEGAWHGLALDQHLLTEASQRAIEAPMTALLGGSAPWSLDDEPYRALARRVAPLAAWPEALPVLPLAETRALLVAMTDTGRAEVLGDIARATAQGDWRTRGKPFLEACWPRQVRLRSEATSRQFAQIAEDAGDDFPDVVRTVLPFVRPITNLDLLAYRLLGGGETPSLITRFPRDALMLLAALIGDERSHVPFDFLRTLDALAAAEPALRRDPDWLRLRDLAT